MKKQIKKVNVVLIALGLLLLGSCGGGNTPVTPVATDPYPQLATQIIGTWYDDPYYTSTRYITFGSNFSPTPIIASSVAGYTYLSLRIATLFGGNDGMGDYAIQIANGKKYIAIYANPASTWEILPTSILTPASGTTKKQLDLQNTSNGNQFSLYAK